MRNFRVRTDAKAWTLRERHDPAQPSSSAYLAVYGWVRGTVARGFLHRICPLLADYVEEVRCKLFWSVIPSL